MKRLFKKKRQKGFTLLETLLSVAIMVIITTMLLNGFSATMGYSYHTSVYSKAAAQNYSSSMGTLSDLHGKSKAYETDGSMVENNYAIAGAVALGKGSYGGANSTSKVKIEFTAQAGYTTNAAGVDVLNDLNAVEFAYTAVPTSIDIGGTIDNTSVAANRRTFFYLPTWNYDPDKIEGAGDPMAEAWLGHVNIYLINTGADKGKYCWGYLEDNTDPKSFVPIGTTFSM
jgi:prepilin-type N-terminal cleavage/methylation domain-containing protein